MSTYLDADTCSAVGCRRRQPRLSLLDMHGTVGGDERTNCVLMDINIANKSSRQRDPSTGRTRLGDVDQHADKITIPAPFSAHDGFLNVRR